MFLAAPLEVLEGGFVTLLVLVGSVVAVHLAVEGHQKSLTLVPHAETFFQVFKDFEVQGLIQQPLQVCADFFTTTLTNAPRYSVRNVAGLLRVPLLL